MARRCMRKRYTATVIGKEPEDQASYFCQACRYYHLRPLTGVEAEEAIAEEIQAVMWSAASLETTKKEAVKVGSIKRTGARLWKFEGGTTWRELKGEEFYEALRCFPHKLEGTIEI